MTTALSIENLTKVYSNGAQALKGINLTVNPGDFFALLGPNGAGKSTTIGIITSLITKTQGTVKVFGHDLDHEREIVKTFIGLVPQEFNFSIFEPPIQILTNQAGYYGIPRPLARERAEYYLNKLSLWQKRHTQSRQLSGGMKRRLMIARALIHHPKLLILDEPTAGVDIEIRRSMWEFFTEINQQGTTIILTTHYLEEAENLCKNIAIIDHGQIIKHTAMDHLLQQLQSETFICYLKHDLTEPPPLTRFHTELITPNTLAVEIHKDQSMNELFAELTSHNIEVMSLRNKTNRLEELFVELTAGNKNVA